MGWIGCITSYTLFTVSRDGMFSNMFATILKWNVRKAAHC